MLRMMCVDWFLVKCLFVEQVNFVSDISYSKICEWKMRNGLLVAFKGSQKRWHHIEHVPLNQQMRPPIWVYSCEWRARWAVIYIWADLTDDSIVFFVVVFAVSTHQCCNIIRRTPNIYRKRKFQFDKLNLLAHLMWLSFLGIVLRLRCRPPEWQIHRCLDYFLPKIMFWNQAKTDTVNRLKIARANFLYALC